MKGYKTNPKLDWKRKDSKIEQVCSQILILCSEVIMTRDDLIHDFAIEFEIDTPEGKETRKLFDWAIKHIDECIMELVKTNHLLVVAN